MSNADMGTGPQPSTTFWTLIDPPFCDMLNQTIIPKYLDLRDVVNLSSVSAPFRQFLKPRQHSHIVQIVQRDAAQRQWTNDGPIRYRNQLPTFGNLTPEEALRQNPILVARLRTAALRQRRMVRVDPSNTARQNEILMKQFASRMPFSQTRTGIDVLVQRQMETKFVCINETQRPLYCHWIDFSGNLAIQDGDRVEAAPADYRRYTMLTVREELPKNVFHQRTALRHSFALCWEEGGPPFCIYQIKRTWGVIDAQTLLRYGYAFPSIAVKFDSEGNIQVGEICSVLRMAAYARELQPTFISLGLETANGPPGGQHADLTLEAQYHLAETFYGLKVPEATPEFIESLRNSHDVRRDFQAGLVRELRMCQELSSSQFDAALPLCLVSPMSIVLEGRDGNGDNDNQT